MKKILLASAACLTLSIQSLALADSFNYSSTDECREAMSNYSEQADSLSDAATDVRTGMAFEEMSRFFRLFSTQSDSGLNEHCTGSTTVEQCTFTFSNVGCDLISKAGSSSSVWQNLLVPLLNKEVDDLNNKQADPAVETEVALICSGSRTSVDWSSCKLK